MTEMSQHFNEELELEYKTNRVVWCVKIVDLIDEALAGYDAFREDYDEYQRRELLAEPVPGEVGAVPTRPTLVGHRILQVADVQTNLV